MYFQKNTRRFGQKALRWNPRAFCVAQTKAILNLFDHVLYLKIQSRAALNVERVPANVMASFFVN